MQLIARTRTAAVTPALSAPVAHGLAKLEGQKALDLPMPSFPTGITALPGLPAFGSKAISLDDFPAPPGDGSPIAIADMAAVRAMQAIRTPAGDEWMIRLAREGMGVIWKEFARRHAQDAGPVQGWLGQALLAATLADTGATSLKLKDRYDRPRPFIVDPTIKPPTKLPTTSSYPSGHASASFAAARVIASLDPKLGAEAWEVAMQVATSRVYGGVHFPSDVIMGARLGIAVADRMLKLKPGVAPEAAIAPLR